MKKPQKPINFRSIFRKSIRIAGGMILVSMIGIVGYEAYGLVAKTTFLRLEQIEVNPLKRLTRDDIISLAEVNPGKDMFSLRIRRIGEQLAKNPWVETVQVRREFPHTLRITVVEREPVAVVSMGYLYYLDRNGNVFKPLTEGDTLDFPVITGVTEDDMVKDPAGCRDAFREALSLISLLEKGGPFALKDVSEIHYDKGFGYTLFTARSAIPVRIGNGDFTAKLQRFGRIYPELQARMVQMEYIDLDYKDKIIVKKG